MQWTFDAIVETLATEGRIELRKFGVFVVKTRKRRRARNPRTNKEVEVEAKNVVTFQPGKVMEEKVRTATFSGKKKFVPVEMDDHEGEEITVGAPARRGDRDELTPNPELPLRSR